MHTLFQKASEGTLITSQGEELNYRVYSDGGVKVEGLNMFENFNSMEEATSFIQKNNIKFF